MHEKLQAFSNLVTSKAGRQILQVQKHSPALMFGAGVVGVVATVVLASRATLKLDEVLAEGQRKLEAVHATEDIVEISDMDRKKAMTLVYTKMALTVCKLYGPAIVIGAASIASLSGAHIVLNRRNVALTAAYAAIDKGFKEYRSRVIDEYGVEKDKEFRFGTEEVEVIKETKNGPVTKKEKRIVGEPSIYARYFDDNSTNWNRTPAYNQVFIASQQSYANDRLRTIGHVFLNEVYDALGLARTKEGAVVGWVLDNKDGGDNYIDFGVFKGDVFQAINFVNGEEKSILLDFNVDGVIWDKI